MSYLDNIPFINGIGVLTYNLSNKTPELPEFYQPEIPDLVDVYNRKSV